MTDTMVQAFDSNEEEISAVASWISARIVGGVSPGEICLFVRSEAEFDRAESVVERSGNQWATLTEVGAGVIITMSCVPEAVTKHLLDFLHFLTDIPEQGNARAPFCSVLLGSTEGEVNDYYD